MSYDKSQFRDIVRTILHEIQLHSPEAEDIVVETCAQESQFGTYLKQLGGGPARGPYQMEQETEEDIWKNLLRYHSGMRDRLRTISGVIIPSPWQMAVNLAYSTAMCRYKYVMFPGNIPSTVSGRAAYWKQYYSTPGGSGTTAEYLENYEKYIK